MPSLPDGRLVGLTYVDTVGVALDGLLIRSSPATGQLTEFGAVDYPSKKTFYGCLVESSPSAENPAVLMQPRKPTPEHEKEVFSEFAAWLADNVEGKPVFISDNPAFDWQWINDGFWRNLGYNPFGHSARRISDFYAGLVGDFRATQKWKRLRVTPHDHNPVHDAMGNLEAFERILRGER